MFHRKVHVLQIYFENLLFKKDLRINEEGHLIHQPDNKLYGISTVPSGVPNSDTQKGPCSCRT